MDTYMKYAGVIHGIWWWTMNMMQTLRCNSSDYFHIKVRSRSRVICHLPGGSLFFPVSVVCSRNMAGICGILHKSTKNRLKTARERKKNLENKRMSLVYKTYEFS